MLWVLADHPNDALAVNDLTFIADLFTDGLTFIVFHLLITICDPPTLEVVWRKLHQHLVAGKDTYEILSHLPGYVSQDLVLILIDRHLEHSVRQRLEHSGRDLYRFFFRHKL